jgi:hypothetical protein
MSFKPEGATVGWGGRLGDLLVSQNSRSIFTAISTSGNAVWLTGQSVQQYQVSANGAMRMGADGNGNNYNSPAVAAAMQQIVSATRGGHVFEADLAAVPGVIEVHDLHLWALTSGMNVATAHLVSAPDADNHAVLDAATKVLASSHHIDHATLQVEPADHSSCGETAW